MKTTSRSQKSEVSSNAAPATPAVDGRFISTLQAYNEGECLTDLSEETRKLAEAVLMTGKPGSVTLKLTFKPASTSGAALVIEDEISTKLPKVNKRSAIFFVDPAFNLLRDNPKQLGLDLKVVPSGREEESAPLREVVNQ